jgi:hypothetical protein
MPHQNNHYYPRLAGCFLLLMFVASSVTNAQIDRSKKEEINITAAFKPSIVRTGKIEFRAEPPAKDTSGYLFKYAITPFLFKTDIGPLEVKPLAYSADKDDRSGTGLYAKLGYGNIQNPFAALSYTANSEKDQFAVHLDHLSAKGQMPDQQYANSSLLVKYRSLINEHQVADFFAGYDYDAYRLYGFDRSSIILPADDIRQNYHHIFTGASYEHIAGSEGQAIFTPSLRFDYLMSNKNVSENGIAFKMPLSYRVSSHIQLHTALDVRATQLNKAGTRLEATPLVQLPLAVQYASGQLTMKGGIIPALKNKKIAVLPDLLIAYTFPESGLRVKAGISNLLDINSMQKIIDINPFVLPLDSLTVFHERLVYAGFDLFNTKGLQLSVKSGFTRFTNMPLFANQGLLGKDFRMLNESALDAIMLEGNLTYVFNNALKFNSTVKGYSFQKQKVYDEAYGLLPLELSFKLEWSPLKQLKARFTTIMWTGTMTQSAVNTDVKLEDAADISMGVDYKLNKKWALWIDLNNIANTRYQRWNQYPSFGFNFMAGVRYVFNKKD